MNKLSSVALSLCRSVALSLCLVLWAAPATAGQWGSLAVISDTIGMEQNQLCVGGISPTLGCPTYAPTLDSSGNVSTTGYVSATAFYGDGSALTGVSTNVSVTTGVSGSLVFRDQAGSLHASNTLVWDAVNGRLGIGTTEPNYTLEIESASGASMSVGGSTSGRLILADGGTRGYIGWGASANLLKIFSSQLSVISGRNFVVERGIVNLNNGQLYVPNSSGNGNVGIGTTSPADTLDVSGTARVVGDAEVSGTIKISGAATDVCNPGNYGRMRRDPASGRFEICLD